MVFPHLWSSVAENRLVKEHTDNVDFYIKYVLQICTESVFTASMKSGGQEGLGGLC